MQLLFSVIIFVIFFNCFFLKINAKCEQSLDYVHIPLIEVFEDKGLRVSINNAKDLEEFQFYYNINKPFNKFASKEKGGIVTDVTDGRWIYVAENEQLAKNDKIYYQVSIKINKTMKKFPIAIESVINVVSLNGNNTLLQGFDSNFSANYGFPPPVISIIKVPEETTSIEPREPTYNCLCPEVINNLADNKRANWEEYVYECKYDSLVETAHHIFSNNTESTLLYVGGGSTLLHKKEIYSWLADSLNIYDLATYITVDKQPYNSCGFLIKLNTIVEKKRILIRFYRDNRYQPVYGPIEPGTKKCIHF